MRKFIAIAAAAGVLVLGAGLALSGGRPFTTTMTGEQEAPGPGDPDGSGTARIVINPGTGELCYELTVEGIDTVTGAHIHEAPPGEAGDVVVPLEPPVSGESGDCITISRELALEILRNPEDYYVNVHTENYPAGAIRGQLSR
jgi:hypothetical protein